jgi:hypothetical protein
LLGAFADALAGADPKLGADDLKALEQLTEPVTLARVAGMAWGLGHHHLARRLRSGPTPGSTFGRRSKPSPGSTPPPGQSVPAPSCGLPARPPRGRHRPGWPP